MRPEAPASVVLTPRLPRLRSTRQLEGMQRGFAFITALFLLVVLGGFAGFIVNLTSNTATSSAIAVQGTRAYEAARAALEWANYQVRDPVGSVLGVSDVPPPCFTSPAAPVLPGALAEFKVQVTCQRYPALAASPNFYEEGRRRSAIYVLVATATSGVVGQPDYAERRIEARIATCKDPDATAVAFSCQ